MSGLQIVTLTLLLPKIHYYSNTKYEANVMTSFTHAQLVGVVGLSTYIYIRHVIYYFTSSKGNLRNVRVERLCRLDFHHMNVPRYKRVLALLLCTHILRRTAYDVAITRTEPQVEGSICMTREQPVASMQMTHVFFLWYMYVASRLAEPCRIARGESLAFLGHV